MHTWTCWWASGHSMLTGHQVWSLSSTPVLLGSWQGPERPRSYFTVFCDPPGYFSCVYTVVFCQIPVRVPDCDLLFLQLCFTLPPRVCVAGFLQSAAASEEALFVWRGVISCSLLSAVIINLLVCPQEKQSGEDFSKFSHLWKIQDKQLCIFSGANLETGCRIGSTL